MAILYKSYGLDDKAHKLMEDLEDGVALMPFTENLPLQSYQDNEVSNLISGTFDSILVADMQLVSDMVNNLSYNSTSHKWLDFQALLLGYVNYGFWSTLWTVTQKQRLIQFAMQIWSRMGTSYSLITVLNCLDIPYTSYWESLGAFVVVELAGDTYGGIVASSQDDVNGTQLQRLTPFEGFVRMETSLMRWQPLWRLTLAIVFYFSPAVTGIGVVYDEFTADLSLAEEPVFS